MLFYSLGIWAVVGVRVVAASFYSMQDTKTPVKIAVVAMTVNVALSLLLMKPMKHSGLALANAIASSVNFTFLFIMLKKKLGRIEGRKISISFIKITVASAVTGLISWFITRGDMWMQDGRAIEKAAILTAVIVSYLAVYIFIMRLLGSEELMYLMNLRKKKS